MDQDMHGPSLYISPLHSKFSFDETPETCLAEALTLPPSYVFSTELLYPYDPSSSKALFVDQGVGSSSSCRLEFHGLDELHPPTEVEQGTLNSFPALDPNLDMNELFTAEHYPASVLGLNLSTPFMSPQSEYAMHPSTPPLTISPHLLHSPMSEYSDSSTSVNAESPYIWNFGPDALTEADHEEFHSNEYVGAPPSYARRPTRKTRARTSYSPYTSHWTRLPRSRQLLAEASDATGDDEPIRTPARRAVGQGTPNYNSTNSDGDFCCETCGYTCKPSRKVDFKRHVNTHYPKMVSGAVICCGIPVEQRYDPEWGYIPEDAQVKTFYGRQMVGGCGRIFSRTDALKRHLELGSVPCVGDVKGDWHPSK